jgi:hypothetical protein
VSETERAYEWPTEDDGERENGANPAELHRPGRAVVAVVEVVLAGLAVWGAFACWSAGIATMSMALNDGTNLVSTRYEGNWMAGAIGLGTLAALLLVDAVREVLLATRAPHRKHRKAKKSATLADTYGPDFA